MSSMTRACAAVPVMAAMAWGAAPAAWAAPSHRIASALGSTDVDHRAAVVQVLVAVPEGHDEAAATERALAAAGAAPLDESGAGADGFAATGFTWPQFSDPSRLPPRNDRPVVQHYNPFGDPTGDHTLGALVNTHATWTGVETSAFRIDLGGTTSRCPSLLCFYGRDPGSRGYTDGFNDVGWIRMPFEPSTLGVVLLAVDPSQQSILEADMVLNASSPLFNSDPEHPDEDPPFDVETVLLHENGHVAGLAHSDDPSTVMFPFVEGVRRTLAPGDEAGIAFLYPLDPPREHPGHPLHPEHPVHPPPPAIVLAGLGDPAPGGGNLFRSFSVGDLTDSGRGSYAANLLVGGVAAGQGVFTADRHRSHEIVRSGQAAPGGGTLGSGIFGRPDQDEAGNIAFAFRLQPFAFPLGVNTGVYRGSATGGPLEAVMVPGVTQAPGGSTFVGAREAAIGGGQVVFNGVTPTASGDLGAGLYRARDGRITTVAAPGDAIPGAGTVFEALDPAVNEAGDVAFAANLEGDPCFHEPDFLVGCDFPANAFLQRAGTGAIETIVRYGMPAPGVENGVFGLVQDLQINEAGDVVFHGRGTVEPEGFSFGGVLYRYTDGELTPVIKDGDALPGGGHLFSPGLVALNDRGEIAFMGALDIDRNGDQRFDDGVYLIRDGSVRLIAGTGTRLPGIGTIARMSGISFAALGFNDRGQLMFPARLTDGRTVLLRTG